MAEGTEERKEQGGRPGGNYNNRRRHHGHRHSNNPNRFNNGPRPESESNNQNRNLEASQQRFGNGPHAPNHSRRDNFGGQRDFGRRHEPIKAHETLEDIQKDILRIEKEIEMEISEISAARLGV